MRRFSGAILAALMPVAGFAQDAVIRIEAKRGSEAATIAAQGWRDRFEDVVTFPLSGDWIGIALGPMPQAGAEARLRQLRAAGQIPSDSFVAAAAPGLTPVPGDDATDAAPQTVVETPVPPGTHIRLDARRNREDADAVLAEWRQTFPEAGLWQLPDGWFAVTLGPMQDATARAWLSAFRDGGLLPKDAFTTVAADLGQEVTPGTAPDLPAPGDAAQMPPLDQVQKALRWAGHYDGDIDGKSGPQTRAAMQAEIMAERLAPDVPGAMRKLLERRAAWRDQMGLVELRDDHTGLSVVAPMDRLQFDRVERVLSIYGPRNDSGSALILFDRAGGQQELQDLGGLVTALGWVPNPDRKVERGHIRLEGRNAEHHGLAEGWVRDGRAQGFVLIWPADDPQNQRRIAAEISDSFQRIPAADSATMPDG